MKNVIDFMAHILANFYYFRRFLNYLSLAHSSFGYRSALHPFAVNSQVLMCLDVRTLNSKIKSAIIFVLDYDHSLKSCGGDISSFISWHFPINLEV